MKMKSVVLVILVVVLVTVLRNGFHRWQYNQTVDGVTYERIRYEQGMVDPGRRSIGYLAEPVELDGLRWKGWLHRRENGSISGGMLDREAVVNEVRLPVDTWVSFDSEGVLESCHFPETRTIQGSECLGTGGGSKGAVVSFYPDGTLKQFFAPADVEIHDVSCRGGFFHSVHLHENGRLRECTLARTTTFDGRALERGERIQLDEDGTLVSP